MTPFTLLRTLSLGYLAQHPTRMFFIILSIALGVAVMVATQALNRGLTVGAQDGVNPLSGLADLQVLKGQIGVELQLAEQIRKAKIDGVADARALIFWRLAVTDLDNKVVWLLGIERTEEDRKKEKAEALLGGDNVLGAEVRAQMPKTLAEKLALLGSWPALLSDNLDAEITAKLGAQARRFKVRNAGQIHEVSRLGTISFTGSDLPLKDSGVILMDAMSASSICFPDRPGRVHQIAIRVAPGYDVAAVQARLEAFLGDRGDVQTTDLSKKMVSDVAGGLEMGVAIGGAVALVVGLFLVYNILSVSVAERRHDIGILRSVGATRGQIAGLFLSEAAVLGVAGSALGLPLGIGLAWATIKPLAGVIGDLLVPIDGARIVVPPWLVGAALIAGTLVAVLAALVPAMQAAGEEPADAVRRAPRHTTAFTVTAQVVSSLVLLAAGVLFALYRHRLPDRVGMFAGPAFIMLGGLVLMPVLASLLGGLIQPFFRYLFGVEGRLAADNLVRAPGRTGIVIAAVAATVALMVGLAGFIKSTRVAIYDWLEEKVGADLFVTSGSSVTSGGAAVSMKEGLGKKLAAIDGVETVLAIRSMLIKYNSPRDGQPHWVFLLGVDYDAFDGKPQDRPLARNFAQYPRVRERGTVAVSHNFALLYGIKVGDRIKLPTPGKAAEVEVVALVTDYSWNRGTILIDRQHFKEIFQDHQADIFDLFLKPGADREKVRDEVMRLYGQEEALFVITRDQIHQDVNALLQKVYAVAYAQQVVLGLVALLGVASALFISVLQRRRELGLLRAVGASRAMVLRSVLAEAVLMGIIGAIVGFAIGLFLETYILQVLARDESGFEFPMTIPWVEGGVVALVAVGLATLAGLWPAYHATRLRIPEAIAYE